MIRLFLSLLLTAGCAQAIVRPSLDVRYHAETGMYRCDLSGQSLTNGQEVVLDLTYPFATVTNVYVQLNGRVEVMSPSRSNGPSDALATIQTPGGWLADTSRLNSLRVRLRAQGAVQLEGITADCGRSMRVLQQWQLPPVKAVQGDTGRVRCESPDRVVLHPREAYYAVSAPHLSAAHMHAYSGLMNTTNRFEASFFVSHSNPYVVTGRVDITLPVWAKAASTRVYFHTPGTRYFGITQPPDSIQFNDDMPHVPAANGWETANTYHGYRQVATNDTMTLTWNGSRSHRLETQFFSLYNPVSFKGRVRYEYLRDDGRWGILIRPPWMICPIPPDASRAPFQMRATCLGGVDRGSFAAQGIVMIPPSLLLEDDRFLSIDDADGRGNPLTGWQIDGLDTRGPQPVLGMTFQLEAQSNPLHMEARGMSSLIHPGAQVLVKVEVTR